MRKHNVGYCFRCSSERTDAVGNCAEKLSFSPIVAGLVIRWLLRKWIDAILPVLPWVSVLGIAYVVVAVVSGSASKIVEAGLLVLLVVILHNGLGYLLGYFASRAFKYPERVARTTAVEVGMQNSGLAATLATQYFSPVAALPAAVFSVWHNISGGLLALFFRWRSARQDARVTVDEEA
ncbi:bile acid:sodium symporter family protein [Gulosibacter faecalis]|uniref:Bile acid:sodium symporter family protein n=1 Tax=Gulosibacter faecalis TaxID=272240 RepID=A0ABW5UWG7_9MICO